MNDKQLKATPPLNLHPAVQHIAQFFSYSHLPENLKSISKPFCDLAAQVMLLPDNPEKSIALRKLLEAKDAAVRCALAK